MSQSKNFRNLLAFDEVMLLFYVPGLPATVVFNVARIINSSSERQ